mgnify:FL=1|jgi:hypothetical protein
MTQLKKQLKKQISGEFVGSVVKEDMTPTMRLVFNWGLRNITKYEMKKIIAMKELLI